MVSSGGGDGVGATDGLAVRADGHRDGLVAFASEAGLGATFKSKNRENIYFVVGNYNLIRSEGEDFQNKWFIHLHYNHEFTNLVRTEVFVQSQQNQVQDVNSRNLIGIGLRLKFVLLKASDTDKNDNAITHYLQALALRPNYEKACNNLANLLLDLGRTDEAIFYYKRALLINPHYAQAQYNLANAYKKSGTTEQGPIALPADN